jgi:hypothetical protein
VGVTIQEWKLDYGEGDIDTCSFTITVIDAEAPSVNCPGDMTVDTDPEECSAVVHFPNLGSIASGEAEPGITLPNAPTAQAGVAYNPIKKLYYSVRAGSPSYLLYTYDETGNQVAQDIAGFDFRGLWWNSNTSSLEGNSYNGNGYRSVDLDANGYALSTGTTNPASNYQPNSQSQGDYDYDLDEVIYCYNNTIYRTSRATGALIDDIAITGLPAGSINSTFVGYSGVPGGEVLLYDYANKAVYFIDKTTGVYSWSVQLPSSAPWQSMYNTSYANDHIWITDGSIWHSYKIVENISDNCDSILVVQTAGLPSGSEFPLGTTTNTFEISDGSGNMTTCTFDVTVEDNEPPVVVANPLDVFLREDGEYVLTQWDIEEMVEGTEDNCTPYDDLEITVFPRTFQCIHVGEPVEVKVTAIDTVGNSYSE